MIGRRVLVTGATGFVGRHLLPALVSQGYRVRGTFREQHHMHVPPGEIEWVRIPDIGPTTDWKEALSGVNLVVHLAGVAHRAVEKDEELADVYQSVNVEGTSRLATAIAERSADITRLVFVSSAKAISGGSETTGNGEQHHTEYGRSKLAAENAIEQILSCTARDWCILKPCLVYGPGNLGNMARLIRLINIGLPLPFASIRNRRSFLYVGNLVAALSVCLEHTAARRRIFTLSDGEAISTPELLYQLGRYSKRRVRLFPMPVRLMKALAKVGDVVKDFTGVSIGWDSYSVDRLCSSLSVDANQFCDDLQWKPPFSMDDGIRSTMSSNRNQVSS